MKAPHFVLGGRHANNIRRSAGPSAVIAPMKVVEPSESIVDFDWASEAGVAEYPAGKNEETPGITWPGSLGEVIQMDDTVALYLRD